MRWILYPFIIVISLVLLGLAAPITIALIAWPSLPSLEALTDYHPKIPLRVYTADHFLLDEFGEERREFVPIEKTPEALRLAILAAEDERFYEHPGIDILGLARATIANITTHGKAQGASTITMQVARNFFLTREKTYNRKFYEILLSLKIEQNLPKDKILEIYINQIYLGQRAYGFAAAAQAYFGKNLNELTLAESAMLAGLPKAPSTYNPIANPARAKLRQQYVLRRMLESKFINQQLYAEACAMDVKVQHSPSTHVAKAHIGTPGAYVAEMARRIAFEQFGEEAYESGLSIITTINKAEQENAYNVLRQNIMDYDRRHGYRGAEAFVDLPERYTAQDGQLEELLNDFEDIGDLHAALVLESSPQKVTVYSHGQTYNITAEGLRFAAPMLSQKAPPTKRIRPGAIIRVQKNNKDQLVIGQLPQVEAALFSMDPISGQVKALVGGFDFGLNKFNHVTQAYRQPGSSFKPFIYSAAFERGYSPTSVFDDSPISFPASTTGGQAWEPKNSDGRYSGPMTLREALARSKNMVTIRVLQAIGPKYAQDYIARFGFEAERHPPYLTMALGAGAVTPWQMGAAYSVFANGGYRVEPYIVKEMIDGTGRVVARVNPAIAGEGAPRVIDPRNAFLVDSMMRDVIKRGTARAALSLGRSDLAGKTGTTNDYVDAWFCGYNPKLVTIAWIGFDQPQSLGRGETGSQAALPIWRDYMRIALKDQPEVSRTPPEGLNRTPGNFGEDYIYKENTPPPPPPAPPNEEPSELPSWLDDFANGRPSTPTPAPNPSPSHMRTPAEIEPAPVEERTLN